MKGTVFNHGFLKKKKSGKGQLGHLSPKMVDPHNSEFGIMKGTKKCMKIIIMVFLEKMILGANGAFWTQKWHILIIVDSP